MSLRSKFEREIHLFDSPDLLFLIGIMAARYNALQGGYARSGGTDVPDSELLEIKLWIDMATEKLRSDWHIEHFEMFINDQQGNASLLTLTHWLHQV